MTALSLGLIIAWAGLALAVVGFDFAKTRRKLGSVPAMGEATKVAVAFALMTGMFWFVGLTAQWGRELCGV